MTVTEHPSLQHLTKCVLTLLMAQQHQRSGRVTHAVCAVLSDTGRAASFLTTPEGNVPRPPLISEPLSPHPTATRVLRLLSLEGFAAGVREDLAAIEELLRTEVNSAPPALRERAAMAGARAAEQWAEVEARALSSRGSGTAKCMDAARAIATELACARYELERAGEQRSREVLERRIVEEVTGHTVGEWARSARNRAGPYGHLADAVVEAFFPERYRRVLAHLIEEGPAVARQRAETALDEYVIKRGVKPTRRKAKDSVARGTVNNWVGDGNRLFRAITQLARDGYALDALEPWKAAAPTVAKPRRLAKKGWTVKSPQPSDVRKALAELDAEIRRRMRCTSSEEELELARNLSKGSLARRLVWRMLRRRAVLDTLVLTGGRGDAIARLNRGDFVVDHVGPHPDFRRGVIVNLYPLKSWAVGQPSPKAVPPGMWLHFQVFWEVTDRLHELGPLSSAAPAFTTDLKSLSRFRKHGVRNEVAGEWPKWTPTKPYEGRAALIPRPETPPRDAVVHWLEDGFAERFTSVEEAQEYLREFTGFSPHEFRHLTYQMAVQAGEMWNETHLQSDPLARKLDPDDYAKLLLDHGGGEPPTLRARYADLGTDEMRELLSSRAAEGIWALMRTDIGMRRRPDEERYDLALEELRDVEAELNALAASQRRLQGRPALQRPSRPTLASPPVGAPLQEQVAYLTHQVDALATGLDHVMAQNDELRDIVLESGDLTFEAVRLSERRAVLIATLDDLRYNEETWTRVPDGAPLKPIDWAAKEQGALGHVIVAELEPSLWLRRWMTTREFMESLDTVRTTVGRWAAGEVPADPDKRPWDPGAIPVELTRDGKYRRIWIPAVNARIWNTEGKRQKRDEILATRAPNEQGWSDRAGNPSDRALRPLVLPEPVASAYEDDEMVVGIDDAAQSLLDAS